MEAINNGKGAESFFSQYSVWVLILSTDGMDEMGGVYSSKDRAKQAFTKHLKDLGGDPADVDFDSYEMTDWYDNEDPMLAYHSIRMYEEKLDSDFELGAEGTEGESAPKLRDSRSVCPTCDSHDVIRDNIEGAGAQNDDRGSHITLTWSCNDCEFGWIETYQFTDWTPTMY